MNQDIKVKDLKHEYDDSFIPSKDYLASMPDIQNSPYAPTTTLERVGIHKFKMPLTILERNGSTQEVCAEITGMVSLEADKAGINMSRILRTFRDYVNGSPHEFNMNVLCGTLREYKEKLESFDAHIIVKFPFRYWQDALRSEDEHGNREGGWQYYDVALDISLDRNGKFRRQIILDFVYSSACPCSTALAEHAAYERGVYGIPHSQRSVARVAIEIDGWVWIEDLIDNLRENLQTETLVFCRRQDEQAFGELNGAHVKFVEDAARIIAKGLDDFAHIADYRLVVSHLESLHSHNAIAVKVKGVEGSLYTPYVTIDEFDSLVK